MTEFEAIKNQLRSFIRKYQLNLLVKGSALFLLIGLLFLLLLLSLENFIWFDTDLRLVLFIAFVVVELVLLVFFIGFPLLKFLDLNRAISDKEAAILIGEYFPKIEDRLLNLIELKSQRNTEILHAAIQQKANELRFYNFNRAVSYGQYRNYILTAMIPVLLILAFFISGRGEWLTNSFNRIRNYNQVYEKPSPFNFVLSSDDPEVIEGEDFLLEVRIIGKEIPQQVKISMGGAEYFLKQTEPGRFAYLFKNVTEHQEFRLITNKISSRTYNLTVIPVPKLINFLIDVNYPSYLDLDAEQFSGDGNLSVPEGSILQWSFKHRNTTQVNLRFSDTVIQVSDSFKKLLMESTAYSISTSNQAIEKYQPLSFQIDIIKDESPKIEVEEHLDSLNSLQKFYGGQLSDDHGISNVILRYRKIGDERFQSENIEFEKGITSEFYTSFPGKLKVSEGSNYEYYFQVFDNDAVNGPKYSSSQYFTYYNSTSEEITDENLNNQQQNIDKLSKEFDRFQDDEDLNNLLEDELENKEFDYEQQQKLKSFIESQQRENELMKNFSKNIEEKLSNLDKQNRKAENLQDRLKNSQEELEDNDNLLKELEEYSKKIQNENLQQMLENLSKQRNSSKRSLEQLVQLTKQFYIEQKYEQIVNKLQELGEQQEDLKKSGKTQDEINTKFSEIQKGLNDLERKNRELKRPKHLDRKKDFEMDIQQDLEKLDGNGAIKNAETKKMEQQRTGQKMKKLAEQMKQNSEQMETNMLMADIESLRKVLDNLVIFSFEQEDLLNDFSGMNSENPQFSGALKRQYQLKENFEHVDDSLFSLGLNNQFIAEEVFQRLEDVSFNINNSLEELSEVKLSKALSSQQYTITGANDLAVMLNEILDNMNNSSKGAGGEGAGQQLPDIMQQQKKLAEDIQNQMQKDRGGDSNNDDGDHSELFEIYKRQEEIRKNLEKVLKENGMSLDDINKDFEEVEEDILDDNINQNSMKVLDNINQKMLDLKQSINEKGEHDERESKSNRLQFENQTPGLNIDIKDYFNSIEILDRQTLPLRPKLKKKINRYFNE